MRNYIKNLACLYQGNYAAMVKHCAAKKPVDEFECVSNFITIADEAYPKVLLELEMPPLILFYKGNLSLLSTSCVGVVGSRKPSAYAKDMTKKAVNVLKEKFTILSGMAYGIDAIAHKAALSHGTIAVLGSGIDVVYPHEHAHLYHMLCMNHLVISEYPPGTKPQRHFFPFRNRIIACLSKKVYVMSAALRSGTMLTVEEALFLNREVICLPHAIDEISGHGCNMLIAEGASLLTNIDDLYNI